MSISVPDPDELMESHVVDEPNDDFDLNNANDMDEDFGPSNAVLLPNASVEEDAHDSNSEQQTTHLVNTVPIDLDSLSQNYTGYALMNRLIFIADTCPPLQKDAILMLINYVVQNTMNVSMYVNAFSRLDSLRNSGQISSSRAGCAETNSGSANPPASVPNIGMHSQCDSQWIESTMAKAQAHLDVLLTEFKLQKDDGVKESTRRALDDLFQHRVQMGHLQDALKLFGKGMREYCTSPKHIIQMLLNWVEVAIHAGQWFDLGPLCGQIEHAIAEAMETETVAATSTSRASRYALNATQAATKTIKELIDKSKAKVAAVIALNRLNARYFKGVAEKCLQIDIDFFNYPSLLAPKDIAVYGSICALATFDRNELKEKVLGNALFKKFLESEPKLVELLQKFCKSEFGTCLDIMEEIQDQLYLDIYLSSHVTELFRLIRRRAIVQYVTPYRSADVRKMANVFRVSVDEMEEELVQLIIDGDIFARIDSYKKVFYAKERNQNLETYTKSIEVGELMRNYAYGLILRTIMHQNQILVSSNENGNRSRRRPAAALGGTACDIQPSSLGNSSLGASRNFMSRIFGTPRNTSAQAQQFPPQAAEADSSNENDPRSSVTTACSSSPSSVPMDIVVSPSSTPSSTPTVLTNESVCISQVSTAEVCPPSLPRSDVCAKLTDDVKQ